jgi:signal transduction histidine kinase
MEMGRFKLKAVAVDLGDILHRIVDLARAGFADKRITIEVDTDTTVGTEVHQVLGDAMLCYSLFQNLIKTACDAAPPSTRVTIVLKDESPLQVTITNKSVVPKDMRERFFDKYATSGKTGGSGIGTYSAQMQARDRQGELSMDTSDSLISTTLTVTLPRHTFDVAQPAD